MRLDKINGYSENAPKKYEGKNMIWPADFNQCHDAFSNLDLDGDAERLDDIIKAHEGMYRIDVAKAIIKDLSWLRIKGEK